MICSPKAALLELVGRLGLGVWEGRIAATLGDGVWPGTFAATAKHRACSQGLAQGTLGPDLAVQLQGTGF